MELETRKLLPGVRPKTRIEALTLAIFFAESELVEACHNAQTKEWAIECKAAILTYQEMLQQENNSMCDKKADISMSIEELGTLKAHHYDEALKIDQLIARKILAEKAVVVNRFVQEDEQRKAARLAERQRQQAEWEAAQQVQTTYQLPSQDEIRARARARTDYFTGVATQPKGE